MCAWVYVCACENERECVFMCVRDRKREGECVHVSGGCM